LNYYNQKVYEVRSTLTVSRLPLFGILLLAVGLSLIMKEFFCYTT
jgi:hypothetical protein